MAKNSPLLEIFHSHSIVGCYLLVNRLPGDLDSDPTAFYCITDLPQTSLFPSINHLINNSVPFL